MLVFMCLKVDKIRGWDRGRVKNKQICVSRRTKTSEDTMQSEKVDSEEEVDICIFGEKFQENNGEF